MSAPSGPVGDVSGLYKRIAEAFDGAINEPCVDTLVSGFAEPVAQKTAGTWQPIADIPARIFGAKAVENAAKVCLFDGRIYVALRGGSFTDFDRQKFSGTIQPLTLIFNGRETLEMPYPFDGRAGWTCFRTDIPDTPTGALIHSVEIDHDGKLLFSGRAKEDSETKNFRATLWLVTSAGRLSGGVTGTNGDIPVEIRVDGQVSWTITNPPMELGRPRRFEFDLKATCANGGLARVSVHNPATGAEAACSPVGVFLSQGEHFLIAVPRIGDGRCRVVLMSWKDGKKRGLTIGDATRPTIETVCRVDGADPEDARFDGGHNSFELDIDRLRTGDLAIVDETEQVLGVLPKLDQMAALT